MKSRSLRRTLLLRCGIGVGVLLCLLSTTVYLIVRHGLFRELERSITQTAALLSNQVELESGAIVFEWKEGVGTNDALQDDGLFQFWNESTGTTTRSSRLKGKDLPKFCGEEGKPLMKMIELPGSGREALAIGMRIYPFVLPNEIDHLKANDAFIDPKSLPHVLVVARDTKSIYRVLTRARWVLVAGTLLTLGLVVLVIRRVIRVTLRPIDDLTNQMSDRAEHQLDSALVLPQELPSELAGLAENFDALLARVARMRNRERDFIRHAAHELRTPIAGLQATTDLALSQPRDAAAYADHLTACQKTAVELGELVKRLSALAHIGQETPPPSRELVDTTATLTDCADAFRSSFEKRCLTLDWSFPAEPLIAKGDITLLRIIFNNLLENASCYAQPNSNILLRGGVTGSEIEIRISNQSDGLPADPERLFEPLFRSDASRNQAEAHLGIGLTLSLEAATSMGATLRARKPNPGEIEFILKMPRA